MTIWYKNKSVLQLLANLITHFKISSCSVKNENSEYIYFLKYYEDTLNFTLSIIRFFQFWAFKSIVRVYYNLEIVETNWWYFLFFRIKFLYVKKIILLYLANHLLWKIVEKKTIILSACSISHKWFQILIFTTSDIWVCFLKFW